MSYELTRLFFGTGEAHSLDNAIKSSLQELQQIVASDALHAFGFLKVSPELTFKHTVDTTDFLLFPELQTVFRLFYPALTMLSGG
jgi:hypothetical protein